MRELVAQYLSKSISRRGFVNRLAKMGVSLAAAQSVLQSLTPLVHGQTRSGGAPSEGVRIFEGTGGEAFAELLPPHEGPGAAMAGGAGLWVRRSQSRGL